MLNLQAFPQPEAAFAQRLRRRIARMGLIRFSPFFDGLVHT